jgi:hypothetical protein
MSNRPNASRFQLILRIRRRALKRQPRTRLQLSRLTCSAISGAMIVRAQTPARAVLSARRGVTCPGHGAVDVSLLLGHRMHHGFGVLVANYRRMIAAIPGASLQLLSRVVTRRPA